MGITIQFLEGGKILEVRLAGGFDKKELQEARDSTALRVQEVGAAKVLVDMREANLNMPAYEIANFAKPLPVSKTTPSGSVAIVIDSDNENARFLETAASNRNSRWNFFHDREEALEYLANMP
jgi:hypothetical protein